MNAVTLPLDLEVPLADPAPAAPSTAVGRAVTLADALDACAGGAPIVTVNRRLSRELSDRFARRRVEVGAAWWETPSILPLSAWLVARHDEALASGVSERARLSPLVATRRWTALLEDGREPLLDVDSAAQEAMRAWRLGHAWDCLPREEDYLSDDQFAWRRWSERHARRLEEERLVDEATLPAHVTALLAAGAIAAPERLVLAGFIAPNPEQRRLIDALRAAGTEVLEIAPGRSAVPRCRSWPDERTELRAIADAVRTRLEVEPDAVLGVIVPDLDARRGDVLRAFDRCFFPLASPQEIERIGRPYDVSLGHPLADAPPVRAALLALRLTVGSVPAHGLSALLLSPYLRDAAPACRSRERLERRLREWRVRSLDLRRFAARLDDEDGLGRSLRALERRAKRWRSGRRSAIADWADRFGEALRAWGWPGEGLSSEEYQAVRALHGTLDDLQALEDGTTVTPAEALAALLRLARERVFQPETPEVPIRILGRLESHGLSFDALWVASLDSEHWPPTGTPSPFLPMARQKAAGMPEASPEARLALARAEFDHWCASCGELVASHARERDGKPLVPAAILADIVPGEFDDADPAASVRAAVALESIEDVRGPAVAPSGGVRGGARLLEDQAECPFRAFARHRLELRPLEEAEIGPDPRQRGNALHLALETFWRRTVSHAELMALDGTTLAERVADCVDAALAADEYMDDVLRRLERVRLLRLIGEWIERAERPREPFVVVDFEREVTFERGGIEVRLRIDRIDRVGDRLVVLDYKTGTHDSIARWAETRLTAPQLPLYALAEETVSGVAFARVAPYDTRFLGVAAEEGLLPGVARGPRDDAREWHEWRAHWSASLDRLAAEVRGGEAGVLPARKACDFCELTRLCRVAPASGAGDEDETVRGDGAVGSGGGRDATARAGTSRDRADGGIAAGDGGAGGEKRDAARGETGR